MEGLSLLSSRVSGLEEQVDQRDRALGHRLEIIESAHSQRNPFNLPPGISRPDYQPTITGTPNRSRPNSSPHQATSSQPPWQYDAGSRAPGSNPTPRPDPLDSDYFSVANAQNAFKELRDKVSNIPCPAELKVRTDRSGIRRDDQAKINLIATCAKFSETLIKVAISDVQDADQLKQDVFAGAAYQQKTLQTEFSVILVDNSFDAATAKLYKQLRKNTSAFDPESLGAIKDAVAVRSQLRPYRPDSNPGRGSYRGSSFRGKSRGYFSGRGRDVYRDSYQAVNFPHSRPDNNDA